MTTSRDAAFLFTDIVGSTPRWESDPEEMGTALPVHDEALTAAFGSAGGEIVKHTGDGLLVVFDDVADAVRAAVEGQRALHRAFAGGERLEVRMGIDCGVAAIHGHDYVGPVLNRAARVMATADGGQIVVTDAARRRCGDAATFADRGKHRLKGITAAVRLFEVVHDLAPTSSRPLNSLNVSTGNLPSASSTIVGREADVDRTLAALEHAQVVTLVGPGGVGKTRLALDVGHRVADRFPDGRWFVDLAAAAADSDVSELVATSVGVERRLGESWAETICEALGGLTALVVIDNCEHMLHSAAHLIEQLASGGALRILATSRMPLQLAGERRIRIDPLDPAAAVALFLDRAAAIDDRRAHSPAFEQSVAEICERLDGLPLALELAAARLETLSAEAIARRLRTDVGLLSTSAPTASERQRALTATLEWSVGLLSPDERAVFLNCSTFRGSFALEAIEATMATDVHPAVPTLDIVDRLVLQSMVLRTEDGAGVQPRFRLLRPVADFAASQLEDDARNALRTRSAHHYRKLAVDAAHGLLSDAEPDWIAELDADHANLSDAFEWFADTDPAEAVTMATDLYSFWIDHDLLREGLRWLSLPCDAPADELVRARGYAAILAFFLGENHTAEQHAATAVELATAAGVAPPPTVAVVQASLRLNRLDTAGALAICTAARTQCTDGTTADDATALSAIAAVVSLVHSDVEAITIARQAVERTRRFGPGRSVSALVNLAFTLQHTDPTAARAVSLDAVRLAQELGSRYFEAFAQLQLGLAARALDRRNESLGALLAALRLQRQVGLRNEAATAIEQIARFAADELPIEAVMLVAAAARLRETVALDGVPAAQRARGRTLQRLRDRLSAAEFEAAWDLGSAQTLDLAGDAAGDVVDRLTSPAP